MPRRHAPQSGQECYRGVIASRDPLIDGDLSGPGYLYFPAWPGRPPGDQPPILSLIRECQSSLVIASEAWQSPNHILPFPRLLRHFVPRNDTKIRGRIQIGKTTREVSLLKLNSRIRVTEVLLTIPPLRTTIISQMKRTEIFNIKWYPGLLGFTRRHNRPVSFNQGVTVLVR